MKILWAFPINNESKTGAEKFYSKLMQEFFQKTDILHTPKIKFISLPRRKNIFEILKTNINNFKTLLPLGAEVLIFQDLLYRRSFILTNIFLDGFLKRKIIIFVNQEYVDLNKISLRGRIILKIMYRIFFNTAYKIIVNSKATARWVNGFGDFSEKIFICYPIIKNESQPKGILQSHKNDEGVLNLLCVANIRKNKGQEYLIEALSILSEKKIKLTLVGHIKDEVYYRRLLDKIKNMGLEGKVDFHGFLIENKLAEAYKNADIFVLPTLLEGFGMVLVEAMSHGLPIVASNVGGIPEIIDDGDNGLLVPAASPGELAKAIKKLIEDKDLRIRLGENAFKKYGQMPLWKESFEKFFKCLYENPCN